MGKPLSVWRKGIGGQDVYWIAPENAIQSVFCSLRNFNRDWMIISCELVRDLGRWSAAIRDTVKYKWASTEVDLCECCNRHKYDPAQLNTLIPGVQLVLFLSCGLISSPNPRTATFPKNANKPPKKPPPSLSLSKILNHWQKQLQTTLMEKNWIMIKSQGLTRIPFVAMNLLARGL